MVANNMKEFCDKNFIKEVDYTTSDNEIRKITVEKFLNLSERSEFSNTMTLLNGNNGKEYSLDEIKSLPSSFISLRNKNHLLTSNVSGIMKSHSLNESCIRTNNQTDSYLDLVKRRITEEYMIIIDTLRESITTLKFFLNSLKDNYSIATSMPSINTSTITTTSNNNNNNSEGILKESPTVGNDDHLQEHLSSLFMKEEDLNKMMNEEKDETGDNESHENINLLKSRLYYEIKNRWHVEEKLKSQYKLFTSFQKMLDCSIKQITENQTIIEELYLRLRKANNRIKELEEENIKLKNKYQDLEKKWYQQTIFNDGLNDNVLSSIEKRKRYSLPLTNFNINAFDLGPDDDKNDYSFQNNNKDNNNSSITLNNSDLSKDFAMRISHNDDDDDNNKNDNNHHRHNNNHSNSSYNSPFTEIKDDDENAILYKTKNYSSVDIYGDNAIENNEKYRTKNLPVSFILNDDLFEKMSHIKNEENNYEKQIEDLVQKTVQYKLEILENNYSYKN
jgi:hypothetical protein